MALAHAEAWIANDERAASCRSAADLTLSELIEADKVDRDPITDTLSTEFPAIMPRYLVTSA